MGDEATHKEMRTLIDSNARIETKLDALLASVGDHETRIRLAESAITVQQQISISQAGHDTRLDAVELLVSNHNKVLSNYAKVLWAIATAAATALVGVVIQALGGPDGSI